MKKARKQPRPSQAQPSRASLREIPEVDLKDGRWRPNPYAARIAAEGMIYPAGFTSPAKAGRGKGQRSVVPRLSRSGSPPASGSSSKRRPRRRASPCTRRSERRS